MNQVNFSTTTDTTEHEAEILVEKMHDISNSLKYFLDEYVDDWLSGISTGKKGELEAKPLLEDKANGALRKHKGSENKINKKKLEEVQQIRQLG